MFGIGSTELLVILVVALIVNPGRGFVDIDNEGRESLRALEWFQIVAGQRPAELRGDALEVDGIQLAQLAEPSSETAPVNGDGPVVLAQDVHDDGLHRGCFGARDEDGARALGSVQQIEEHPLVLLHHGREFRGPEVWDLLAADPSDGVVGLDTGCGYAFFCSILKKSCFLT